MSGERGCSTRWPRWSERVSPGVTARKVIHRLEELLLAVLFFAAFAVLAAQILGRHFLPYPLAWSEEAARFLFLWIVFLGAAYLVRRNGHIASTLLTRRMPARLRTAVYIAVQFAVLVFSILLCFQGAQVAFKVRRLPTIAMEISSAWEYAAVPVSAAVIAVRTLFGIIRAFREGAPESEDSSSM